MRRPRGPVLVVLICAYFIVTVPQQLASAHPPRPAANVLIITIDTLRADRLSCYAPDSAPTPYIDKLAEQGVLFSRAFAHTTLTLPSHANIFLGTTPLLHGVHTNTSTTVHDRFLTLAEHFKTAGFHTGAFIGGSTLDSRFGLDQGFDVYDDDFKIKGAIKFHEAERTAEETVGRAIGWLRAVRTPWFLWVHLFDPHYPYEPPEPFHTEYSEAPYDGEVVYTDATVGRLFDFLKKIGQDRTTAIVLTSDHGESLGDHGEETHGILAYNPTLWIPLILYYPGIKPAEISQPVAHIDIFPTVCDLLGLEKPRSLQGLSLRPTLQGKQLEPRQIYFESLEPYYNMGWAPLTGFIEQNMKFVDSPIPEIYDLDIDFSEAKNRVNTRDLQKFREKLAGLSQKLSLGNSKADSARLNPNLMNQLRSLGYIAPAMREKNQRFGPDRDVKTLLPMYNQVMEAYGQRGTAGIEQSITKLERLIRNPVCIDQAYIYLAKMHHESGRLRKALQTLGEGLERFGDSYEILRNYVDYLIEAREFPSAIRLILGFNSLFMVQDPYIWLLLGVAHQNNREADEAITAFEKAIAIDEEYIDAYQNLGALVLSRWLTQKTQADYHRAIDLFNRIISIDPENSGAYSTRGMAYLQWGRTEAAIQSWETSIKLAPDAGKTYYYLGVAYLSKEDRPHAYINLTKYKQKYYHLLSTDEQKKLDRLIQLARD
jgi:arylsulfatase A-like enzyme/Flp pilus assembly protein TadD